MKKAVRVRDGFQGSQEGPAFPSTMAKTIGKVTTDYTKTGDWYRVTIDLGEKTVCWSYMEKWLEFGWVDKNGNFTTHEPKKGYRVKKMDTIRERKCSWNPRMDKTMGKVSFHFTEDPIDNTVKLTFDDGRTWWYDAEWLEEVYEETKPTSKKIEEKKEVDVKKFIVIGGYRGEDDEFEDGYHHIPTGNIQEAVHIGPKTVDLKYMSCTQSVKIDDVIEVQEDCDYDITIHTKESEYATVTHIEKEKPIEYKRITEVVIGPPSRLIKLLEDQGYELKPGGWGKKDKFFFNFDMINFSGKAPATEYFWEDDWIEEKHTSQSIIDEIMTIKKQFIGDDYYSEDDRKTIYGWSDEDAKKVLRDMVYTLTKSRSKDDLLLSGFCPFCRFHERSCSECSYAENHGKCNQSDSDYKRLMKNLGNKMETGSIILNVIFSNPITKNLGDK